MRDEVTIAADAEARAGDTPEEQRIRTGHHWMALQDLNGYLVLGDPAARLAISALRAGLRASADAEERPAPSAPAAELWSAPPAPGEGTPPAPAESAAPAPDAIAIEAAVHDLLAGRATAGDLAARHGVAPSTVEHWRRVYTEAGRAAVAALSANRGGSGSGA